jgi:hypothetical protein
MTHPIRPCATCMHHRVATLRNGGTDDACAKTATPGTNNGGGMMLRCDAMRHDAALCGLAARHWQPRRGGPLLRVVEGGAA